MWELSFLPFPGLFVPWEATLVGSGIIIRDPAAGLGAVLMLWARCPGGHEHLWKALEWLLILLTQHRFVGKPRILSSLLLPQPASLLALKAEEHRAWTKGSQCSCPQKPDSSGLGEAAEVLDARASACSAGHISRQVLSSESVSFAALPIPSHRVGRVFPETRSPWACSQLGATQL